jgi:hypothetical protein
MTKLQSLIAAFSASQGRVRRAALIEDWLHGDPRLAVVAREARAQLSPSSVRTRRR